MALEQQQNHLCSFLSVFFLPNSIIHFVFFQVSRPALLLLQGSLVPFELLLCLLVVKNYDYNRRKC